MESKEEDVKLGANKFSERQPLGTAAQSKDYKEPPPAPCLSQGSSSHGPFTEQALQSSWPPSCFCTSQF
ncbi:hypothetical protein L1049_003527 [Liquidambar formosana]|uniref:Uncharacterized protein n=1 Tax=Liquidambar formosana TaxID=63359 RepID=A0AAP0QX89_LIQFO